MKYLMLTFDLEEFVAREWGSHDSFERMMKYSREGFIRLRKMLKEEQVPATLFVTWDFAQRNEDLIRESVEDGCEIALHALHHTDNFRLLSPDESYRRLRHAKKLIEKISHTAITGFRGPNMFSPPVHVLQQIGITYSSSVHPTYIPGRYNGFQYPARPYYDGGLLILPVSVTPTIRLPFSWIWFRNLGLAFARMCTRAVLRKNDHILLYFHPWEYADINKKRYKHLLPPGTLRKTGPAALAQLQAYIHFTHQQGLVPVTISEYIRRMKRSGAAPKKMRTERTG